MNSDLVFSVCNTLALPGWLLLIFAPRWKWTERITAGVIVFILSLTYLVLVIQNFNLSDVKSFGTLDGVARLFQNKNMLLAGWIHYLAFDLMMGLFEVKNGQKYNLPHMLIIVCLILTYMLGPIGLLLYLVIRFVKTRNYFAANY